jgi:hypothetical protein
MSRSVFCSPHVAALPLLVPAFGLAFLLGAAASPVDIRRAAPLYATCLAGASVCFVAGVFWARRHPAACSGAMGMTIILGTAIVIRMGLLPIRPTLSTDIYRYLWDGRVISAGVNPYALPPSAPELAALRGPDWAYINFRQVRTAYPPVSEALFGLVAFLRPDSILAMKLALGGCELACMGLVAALLRRMKRPRSDLLLYAWSPLVIAETWLHGHNDSLGVALLMAGLLVIAVPPPLASSAFRSAAKGLSGWSAGVWIGLAAMAKLHALLALPILSPRIGRRGLVMAAAMMAACVLPFLGAGPHLMEGAQNMAWGWSVNGSLYPLLRAVCRLAGLGVAATRALSAGLLVLGLVLLARRSRAESMALCDIYRRLGYALLWGLLLSPVLQPWYLVWVAPFVALAPTASFLIFTSVVSLWYLGGAVPALSYMPIYACLTVEGWRAWRSGCALAKTGRHTRPSPTDERPAGTRGPRN